MFEIYADLSDLAAKPMIQFLVPESLESQAPQGGGTTETEVAEDFLDSDIPPPPKFAPPPVPKMGKSSIPKPKPRKSLSTGLSPVPAPRRTRQSVIEPKLSSKLPFNIEGLVLDTTEGLRPHFPSLASKWTQNDTNGLLENSDQKGAKFQWSPSKGTLFIQKNDKYKIWNKDAEDPQIKMLCQKLRDFPGSEILKAIKDTWEINKLSYFTELKYCNLGQSVSFEFNTHQQETVVLSNIKTNKGYLYFRSDGPEIIICPYKYMTSSGPSAQGDRLSQMFLESTEDSSQSSLESSSSDPGPKTGKCELKEVVPKLPPKQNTYYKVQQPQESSQPKKGLPSKSKRQAPTPTPTKRQAPLPPTKEQGHPPPTKEQAPAPPKEQAPLPPKGQAPLQEEYDKDHPPTDTKSEETKPLKSKKEDPLEEESEKDSKPESDKEPEKPLSPKKEESDKDQKLPQEESDKDYLAEVLLPPKDTESGKRPALIPLQEDSEKDQQPSQEDSEKDDLLEKSNPIRLQPGRRMLRKSHKKKIHLSPKPKTPLPSSQPPHAPLQQSKTLSFFDQITYAFGGLVLVGVSMICYNKMRNKRATTGTLPPAATSGILRPAATSGILPPAATSGILRPVATSGILRPVATSGILRPAATSGKPSAKHQKK
eukprot:GHVP01042131.1.p1 GENE.GHVP01042131.1~~GHVP01042131.1.p1  ORF type:complete len:650 (+),score=170.04 GHVP01042131.1:58-2007(+)